MMRFEITVLILALSFVAVTAQQCSISCPQDCQFGFRLDRTDENCPRCVCSDDICMRVRCTANTTCKMVTNKDCWNSQCIDVASARCVSIYKKGKCPAEQVLSNKPATECSNDADCSGDLKCCTRGQSSVCTDPCPLVTCKCAKTAKISVDVNSKGCSVCKCVSDNKDLNSDSCSQKLQPGNCRGAINRFYFDSTSNSCKQFTYTGCQGNDNNFLSLEYCEKKCVKTSRDLTSESNDVCALPKVVGPCMASMDRYFYNTQTKKCESFIFGGCQANGNNFKTLDECQSRCSGYKEPSTTGSILKNKCNLPKQVGECRASIPRYYFNSISNKCEEFLYSGCSGNDNNFATFAECTTECLSNEEELSKKLLPMCTKPKDIGTCRGSFQKYYFNMQTKTCEEFTYGGCGGNDNNFNNYLDCYKSCGANFSEHTYNLFNVDIQPKSPKCLLEKKVGSCKAIFPRFFFNTATKKCEEFTYGGCEGNENNFESMEDCQKECYSSSANTKVGTQDSICGLEKSPGPCRGYFIRYFFNPNLQNCEQFVYGGCQGNANNFKTFEECSGKCMASTQSMPSYPQITANPQVTTTPSAAYTCSLVKDAGPCYAYFIRYYYDINSKKCEQFVYGGCGGNPNNFESIDDCNRKCVSTYYVTNPVTPPVTTSNRDRCYPDPDVGPCRGSFARYFYNRNTGKCELFTYGGCAGNDNRFDTQAACMAICSPSATTPPNYGVTPPATGGYQVTTQQTGGYQITTPKPFSSTCTLPQDSGNCYGYFPKFFYNYQTRECEYFIYGGCGGNENRFDSQDECYRQCTGSAGTTSRPVVTPPVTTIKASKCLQDADIGPCKGSFGKYFFNKASGQCELFVYGGCGGNDNRFDTYSQCTSECSTYTKPVVVTTATMPVNTNVCQLGSDPGPCKGSFAKYFFNKNSGKCEVFVYGGCSGNGNRFDTLTDCNNRCASGLGYYSPRSEVPSKCLQAKESGMCMAYMPRYYYDQSTQRCEQFIYGGCGANENNFETIQGCIKECSDISNYNINQKCRADKDAGKCKGSFRKYYFNTSTSTCEEFIYGGCGGNDNNFETLEDCNVQCFNLKAN